MFVAIIQSAITIVTSAPCLPYYDLFIWFALTCRFSTEVQFYRQASHFPRVSVPPPDFSLSLFPEDGTSRLKAFSSFSFFKSHTQIHTRKKNHSISFLMLHSNSAILPSLHPLLLYLNVPSLPCCSTLLHHESLYIDM